MFYYYSDWPSSLKGMGVTIKCLRYKAALKKNSEMKEIDASIFLGTEHVIC